MSFLPWVLRIELGSSGRAESALNHLAMCSAPYMWFFFFIHLLRLISYPDDSKKTVTECTVYSLNIKIYVCLYILIKTVFSVCSFVLYVHMYHLRLAEDLLA